MAVVLSRIELAVTEGGRKWMCWTRLRQVVNLDRKFKLLRFGLILDIL